MTYGERFSIFELGVRVCNEGSHLKAREYHCLEYAKQVLANAKILEQDVKRPSMSRNDAVNALKEALEPYFNLQEDLIYAINMFFEDAESPWIDENGRVLTIDKVNSPAEIRLKLLKYLQGGTQRDNDRNRQDIADHFNTSLNTVDKYLKELKNEDTFLMGARIPPVELRYGRNSYDNTVHPVMLPLNLTEVFFLTAILPEQCRSTPYEDTARNIGQKVYGSLSDYARKAMEPHLRERGIQYWNVEPCYEIEDSTAFITLEKSQARCRVWLEGEEEPLTGHFTIHGDGNFRLEDGRSITVDRDAIRFIERI